MRTDARPMLSLLILLAAFAVIGCSGRLQLGEVKGTVKLNGKPLPKIMVEFVPEQPTGPRSLGTTEASGPAMVSEMTALGNTLYFVSDAGTFQVLAAGPPPTDPACR